MLGLRIRRRLTSHRPSKSSLLRRRGTVQDSAGVQPIQVSRANGIPATQGLIGERRRIDSPMESHDTFENPRARSRPSTRGSTSNYIRDKSRPSTRDSLDSQEAFALLTTAPLPPVRALSPAPTRQRARTESRKQRNQPRTAVPPASHAYSRPQTSEGVVPFPGLPPDAPLPPLPTSLRLSTQRDMMREIERLLVATQEFESKAAELQATVRYLQRRVESSPITVQ